MYFLLRRFIKNGRAYMAWREYHTKEAMESWAEYYISRGEDVEIHRGRSPIMIHDTIRDDRYHNERAKTFLVNKERQ
jgi:hypothetical protein